MIRNSSWKPDAARKSTELIFACVRNPLRLLLRIPGIGVQPIPLLVPLRMPVFFFSVGRGEDACVSNDGAEFADHNAAWKEMTGVCGELIADVSRRLSENAEWQMELLDESKKPLSRIRLVAETLQDDQDS